MFDGAFVLPLNSHPTRCQRRYGLDMQVGAFPVPKRLARSTGPSNVTTLKASPSPLSHCPIIFPPSPQGLIGTGGDESSVLRSKHILLRILPCGLSPNTHFHLDNQSLTCPSHANRCRVHVFYGKLSRSSMCDHKSSEVPCRRLNRPGNSLSTKAWSSCIGAPPTATTGQLQQHRDLNAQFVAALADHYSEQPHQAAQPPWLLIGASSPPLTRHSDSIHILRALSLPKPLQLRSHRRYTPILQDLRRQLQESKSL